MNASHLHLVVNHLPFAFAFVALLVMLVGFIGKNASIKKVSLALMVLTAMAGAGSYFSGTAADIYDDSMEQHDQLERHEDSAKTTWIVGLVGGVVGLAGLLLARRMQEVPTLLMLVALVVLLFSMYLFMKTANLGGQIFHPEMRGDPATKFLNPGS